MIVKVLFKIADQERIMLFGNSYKTWREQYEEFFHRRHREFNGQCEPLKVWKSPARWKEFGGLKWCEEKNFQHELNREDVQGSEPDNPNPRKYSDMIFTEMPLSELPK